jgi:hypothetical protein
MEDAFSRPVDEVLANFDVGEISGLSDAQVTELRKKHGRNCTSAPRSNPATNFEELVLTINIVSYPGRAPDSPLGACPRTVQRSTCHHPPRFRRCFLRSRSL